MDGSIRDRSADVYSKSDVEDVVGYPESDSVSEPEWDNDLAWATDAAVSRKRSLSCTSAEKTAMLQSSKRSRSSHGGSTTVNISPVQRVAEFPALLLMMESFYALHARWKCP